MQLLLLYLLITIYIVYISFPHCILSFKCLGGAMLPTNTSLDLEISLPLAFCLYHFSRILDSQMCMISNFTTFPQHNGRDVSFTYTEITFQSDSFHNWSLIPSWHPSHTSSQISSSIIVFSSSSHFPFNIPCVLYIICY